VAASGALFYPAHCTLARRPFYRRWNMLGTRGRGFASFATRWREARTLRMRGTGMDAGRNGFHAQQAAVLQRL